MHIDIHQAHKKKLVVHMGRPRTIKIANNLVQFMKNAYREEKALIV
jgi:hypothetical protein